MYINKAVREMSPPRYTKEDAAKLAGISMSTIKRWKDEGIFVPAETRHFGKLAVDLYTPEDIPKLRAIKKANRPGRKAKNGEESTSTGAN